MSDEKERKDAGQTEEKPEPLTDEESGEAVGGLSQADLERWAVRGPVNRSNFGPGAGE